MTALPVHPLARQLKERTLDPEEFDERVRRLLADEERIQDLVALIAWFRRRYPTVEERLAYVRRKMRDLAKSGSPER
jgi:hypothetical protein